MQTVLVVDDHQIFRRSIANLVTGASNNSITAVESSGKDCIGLVRKSNFRLVLIGTTLSTIDPIELLKQLRHDSPGLPVLVFSSTEEEQYFRRLLRAGASGILTRESTAGEAAEAVEKLLAGRKYISPSLAEMLTDFTPDNDAPLSEALSDREYEVMISIVSGKRIKQIADEMSLSVKTVSTYHSRILQKLNLDNDSRLIRYAIEQGIIKDSISAREKLLVREFNIRTASLIQAIREIWRQRKLVIIVIGILGIIAYFVLYYLIKFVF